MNHLLKKALSFTTLEIANNVELYWVQSDKRGTIYAEDLFLDIEDAIDEAVTRLIEGHDILVSHLMEEYQEQFFETAKLEIDQHGLFEGGIGPVKSTIPYSSGDKDILVWISSQARQSERK